MLDVHEYVVKKGLYESRENQKFYKESGYQKVIIIFS